MPKSDMIGTEGEITAIYRGGCAMPRADFIETEGTVIRMRGHGFYTVVLANGHEVLARMSGRMSKNHIRVIPGRSRAAGDQPGRLVEGAHRLPL